MNDKLTNDLQAMCRQADRDGMVQVGIPYAMPIGERALVPDRVVEARVRRAVARDSGERLVKSRSAAQRQEFGDYYIADAHFGNPQRWHLDLESLATEFGVLRGWEVMEP